MPSGHCHCDGVKKQTSRPFVLFGMNKKKLGIIIGIGVVIVLIGVAAYFLYPRDMGSPSPGKPPSNEQAENQVRKVVEDFGRSLKNVYVISPNAELISSLRENYSPYLAPDLLESWINNPEQVVGREVSSPWPDRIRINSVNQVSETEYDVKGDIIEVTSTTDVVGGEASGYRPINLKLKRIEEKWLITEVSAGDYVLNTEDWSSYHSERYGLSFKYPTRLEEDYISIASDPRPSIEIAEGNLTCDLINSPNVKVERRKIADRDFCISSRSAGAAGSVFTEYSYATEHEGLVVTGNFTLRYLQCDNYLEAERELCQREREIFDLDLRIGQIIDSLERNEGK